MYSFGVVMWGMMSLKKPFGKCKRRKEFEKALSRIEKVLVINRKWPRSIQDTIRRSVAVNFAERPTMSDVCNVINCLVVELEDGAFESAATPTLKKSTSFALLSRLPSKKEFYEEDFRSLLLFLPLRLKGLGP